MTQRKKMDPRLASSRSYHRLAGKAWKAGDTGAAINFTRQAERIYAQYLREQESRKQRAAYEKRRLEEVAKRRAAREEQA